MSKRGRPVFIPTRDQRLQVSTLVACGYPLEYVSEFLEIDIKTLNKRFPKEILMANAKAEADLFKVAYFKARRDEDNMMIMFCLNRFERMRLARIKSGEDAPPPPALGISFEDGGPGKQRTTPYDFENDPHRNWPSGADRLGDPSDPAPTPAEPPAQEFIPRIEAPKPSTTLEMWARLGQTPEQFRAAQPKALEPVRCCGLPACPCAACIGNRARTHSHLSSERAQ